MAIGALSRFCEIGELAGSGRPYNVRDTHPIERMANRRDLTVPDFWTLIAATNASRFGHFRRPCIGVEMGPEMRHPKPRLRARKRVAQIGGGLVAIPPRIARELRTNRCVLTGPSFWPLIAAKKTYFRARFHPYSGLPKMRQTLGILSLD